MRPSFLCLGFQKCGTTTLYDLLVQHKDIALPWDVKEPMYYRVPGVYKIGGSRYYEWRYFGHIPKDDARLVGEVNAGLTFSGCAKRLSRDFSPETKTIFLMRDPVRRAWSAYKFFCALGFLPLSVIEQDRKLGHALAFDQYVHQTLSTPSSREKVKKKPFQYLVFSQGNYETCIREFDAAFPHQKYILFEEFVQNEQAICEDLYRYLGVENDPNVIYNIHANETKRAAAGPLRARTREIVKGVDYALDEFFAVSQWAPPVYELYHKFNRKMFYLCTRPDTDNSKMLPETRRFLQDYYRPEKELLEKRLGRDLSALWYQ